MNIIRHKQTVKLGSGVGWGTEYWTEEDWQEHREYVQELKEQGDYLKEIEMTMDIVSCPMFDNRPKPTLSGKAVGMLIPINNYE